jgi:hypothetical protein
MMDFSLSNTVFRLNFRRQIKSLSGGFMRKFGYGLWVFIMTLGLGVASQTFADDFSLDGAQFARAKKAAVATDLEPAKMEMGSGLWVSLYAGYDFANLGALGSDEKGLLDAAHAGGDTSTDGVDGNGILAGFAVGYDLDKRSALSLSVENTWTAESGMNITTGTDAGLFEKFTPTLLGVALNYDFTILRDKGMTTTLMVGGGFYHASVHYDSDFSGDHVIGDFGQDNIGGTLGVREAVDLGGSLQLGLTARFRAADFGKLTAKDFQDNGVDESTGGPFALVTLPVSTFNEVIPVPTSVSLPSGINDTDLDYTGFDGNVSLTLSL